MKQHVAKVTATCLYHLRRLRQIRRRVGAEVTTQLVLAFITSRLDYCNSVLAGIPLSTLEPLQRAQNAAVRLILQLGKGGHVSPGLPEQHHRDNRQQFIAFASWTCSVELITSQHSCRF